jgi:hypothetical protein
MNLTDAQYHIEIFLAEQGVSGKTFSDVGKPPGDLVSDFYSYLLACGALTPFEAHLAWAFMAIQSTKGKGPAREFMTHVDAVVCALCDAGTLWGTHPFGDEDHRGLSGIVFEEEPALEALGINVPDENMDCLIDEDRLECYTSTHKDTGDRCDSISLRSIALDLARYASHPACRAL